MTHRMARSPQTTPYRRRGRTGWWATYYDASGRRRVIKVGDGSYERAVIERQRVVDRAQRVKDGLATERELAVSDSRQTPIVDALATMLDEARYRKRSDSTRDGLEYWIGRLCKRPGVTSLMSLTPATVRSWLDGITDSGSSPSTHNHALAAVRILCRWCVDRAMLLEDPTRGLVKLNEDEDTRCVSRALTHAELSALIIACPSPERRLRYLLGARAGLRQNEIDRLRWRHLDTEAGWVRLDAALTKSKRADDLPMDPSVKAAAEAIRPLGAKADAMVFAAPVNRRTWLKDLARAGMITIEGAKGPDLQGAKLIGYRDDRDRTLAITCLRKTFGTHLAMVNPNIAEVSKLMRHTDPKLTLSLYTDARLLDLRGGLSRLPSLDTGKPKQAKKQA